jgi:hypothetical protein
MRTSGWSLADRPANKHQEGADDIMDITGLILVDQSQFRAHSKPVWKNMGQPGLRTRQQFGSTLCAELDPNYSNFTSKKVFIVYAFFWKL